MLATKYEVKIVTGKEWDRIVSSDDRYEHVTDENMGFADPKKGKAYVRQTYWPELNKYLLNHEFGHLLEEEGTDEDEHGVRHKKVFKEGLGGFLTAPVRAIERLGSSAKKATRTPTIPDLSQLPSVQRFQQLSQNQYSPLLSRLQNLQNTPLPGALSSPIYREFQQGQRNLYNQYAAAQPGVDLATSTGPTGYQSATNDLQQRLAESLASAQLGYQGNERNNILSQFGVTNQALNDQFLSPQLDVDTIMAQTGLNAEQVRQYREMLGNLAGGVGKAAGARLFRP